MQEVRCQPLCLSRIITRSSTTDSYSILVSTRFEDLMLSFHKVHHIKRPIRKAGIDLALDIPQHPLLGINTLHEVEHFFQRRYPSFWIRELMRYI